MECPICLDKIKRARHSLTASCQECDKSFHMECLITSAANGATTCPMCRCRWPVALVDADTELFWTCEKCYKEFASLNKCEAHEANCGKSFIHRFFTRK
jgi:hypothetical protein